MSRIFKYDLVVEPRQIIYLPKNAELLHVAIQGGLLKLWALVNEENEPEQRIIRLVTTGEVFNSTGCVHIGTFEADGWFIGHVFEQLQLGQSDPTSLRFLDDYRQIRSDLNAETNDVA